MAFIVDETSLPQALVLLGIAHRLDNIRHFLSGYKAISVGVVQIECPVEQVLLGPLDQHGQGDDELLVRQLPTNTCLL